MNPTQRSEAGLMNHMMKFKNVVFDDSDAEQVTGNDYGLSLEKLGLGPRKKLLVLDQAGLLIDRVHRDDKASIPNYCSPDGEFRNQIVFKRPFCDEFMKFCFERFEVGIWSSAMGHNVEGVFDSAMRGLRGKLLFVWDQEECTDTGFKTLKKDKPIFLKELKKLWENKDYKLPWHRGQYSSSNTLLIDDTPYKALLNPPNTAIFPPPYKATDYVNDTALGPNGELLLYLDGLAYADDVPSYVKGHPFGQPAITPTHSDWDYYSKIIHHFDKGRAAEDKI